MNSPSYMVLKESPPEGPEPIISLENLCKVLISLNRVLQKEKKTPTPAHHNTE
jgi:hypothetical protein